MPITPTPFGTPGGAKDNPDYVTASSAAAGPEGIAEEMVKLGNMVAGTQARIVADEAVMLTTSSTAGGDLSGTFAAPVVAKIHGVPITTPPGTATVFLRGDGTWTTIASSTLAGVAVSGTPISGQVLMATSSNTATWQTIGTTTGGTYTAAYTAAY